MRYVLARADRLGLRHLLHHVRRAVHDVRRLHPLRGRPCPRRHALPQAVAARAGQARAHALHPVLLPGRDRADLCRHQLTRRSRGATSRSASYSPANIPIYPLKIADPADRPLPAAPGHRRGDALHHVPARRALAAAAARRRGDRDRGPARARGRDAASPASGPSDDRPPDRPGDARRACSSSSCWASRSRSACWRSACSSASTPWISGSSTSWSRRPTRS